MKDDVLIDYAYPCMMAEKAMKKLHDAMLMKKYDEALEAAEQALIEVRMTEIAIRHMKEQNNAVRQQATPVQERVPTTVGTGRARETHGASASQTRH